MLVYDKLTIDIESHIVTYDDTPVDLNHKQYCLLKLFLEYPNHVLTYDVIAGNIWDLERTPTPGNLRAHIKGLRKALRDANCEDDIIETVHGIGYRLKNLNINKQSQSAKLPPAYVIKNFLASQSIEYLAIDQNWIIQNLSEGVVNYSDYPEFIKIGMPLQEGFPEFIGIEDILLKVITKEYESFELKGIARASNPNRPEYINFHVVNDKSQDPDKLEKKLLFIFFENASEYMIYKQRFVQRENETYLLLEYRDNEGRMDDPIATQD
ncbi:winged helix-turn-helix domain-containing protein [Limnofasciculus baicalensis]|uniref:Winged helix-turn-helix domain-containing protein n=1 Tax=Limnofasciculus baicalensis BBK-W-15 TaxID=2699891 RepID=A0AAE3KME2_9CYAN|nr:winged helix-turn-helix domain-containing protein [Limnofasciculus baicalensis]MCP2727558.1 winged helix-turn-helix domain-containing protein [Limnofasciculus baicalensis BBK-W-15]